MCNQITWDELLEEYFFAHRLRPATEWSYNKVVRGFRRYFGDTPAGANCAPSGAGVAALSASG